MDKTGSFGKGSIPGLPEIGPNDFQEVKMKLSKWAALVDRGWVDIRTRTISLPKNASNLFAQHGYGHYLQSLSFPLKQYKAIERSSFLNALKNGLDCGESYHPFWTERVANRSSGEFSGPTASINWKSTGKYNGPDKWKAKIHHKLFTRDGI